MRDKRGFVYFSLIFYLVDPDYRGSHPHLREVFKKGEFDLALLLQVAKQNKTSFVVCKELMSSFPSVVTDEVRNTVHRGQQCMKMRDETIAFTTGLLSKHSIPFLLIKTLKSIEHFTQDIDIFVREKHWSALIALLKEKGAVEIDGRFLPVLKALHLGQPNYKFRELLKIDVYKNIPSWPQLLTLDKDFLWERHKTVKLEKCTLSIPSYEAQFLLLVSDILFTDRQIPLLDFLYFKKLFKEELHFETMYAAIASYRWGEVFKQIVHSLEEMITHIYEAEPFPSHVSFPYHIPFSTFLRAVKGPLWYNMKSKPLASLGLLLCVFHHCVAGHIYRFISDKILYK